MLDGFEQTPQQFLVLELEQEPQQLAALEDSLEAPPQDPQQLEEAWLCKQPLKNKRDNSERRVIKNFVFFIYSNLEKTSFKASY